MLKPVVKNGSESQWGGGGGGVFTAGAGASTPFGAPGSESEMLAVSVRAEVEVTTASARIGTAIHSTPAQISTPRTREGHTRSSSSGAAAERGARASALASSSNAPRTWSAGPPKIAK